MHFLALFMLKLVLSASTRQTFDVKPTGSSMNCSHQPCQPLDQYAQQPDSYIKTGAMFLFLPGNHSLHFTVSLINVSDVVLRGIENSSVVTVFCMTDIAIQCNNVTNLRIRGIIFRLYSVGSTDKIVLRLLHSGNVSLVNITFQSNSEVTETSVNSGAIFCQNSSITVVSCLIKENSGDFGGAFFASGGSKITLTGNVFIANRATQTGGAIFAQDSSLVLNETPGNTFMNNAAKISGGAIHILRSRLEISSDGTTSENMPPTTTEGAVPIPCLINHNTDGEIRHIPLQQHLSYFSNNQALQGGAIHFSDHSTASLNGTVVIFRNNSANVGGAIASSRSSAVAFSSKHLCFTGNRALVGGGAYFGNQGSLSVGHIETNNSHYFTDNTGGTIHYQNGNLTIHGTSQFKSNYGIGRIRNGGAVYVDNCKLTLSGMALFAHNRADSFGGAIYMLRSDATFDGIVIEFVNNSADLGGAIVTDDSTVTSSTRFLNFTGNTARRAGGAYYGNEGSLKLGGFDNSVHHFANNSAGRNSGGAIHFHRGNLTISGNSTFTGNYVIYVGIDGNGGAIFVITCNFTLSGIVLFAHNHAQQGGAVYIMNTTSFFAGMVNIIGNSAHLVGGGFAIGLSRIVIEAEQLNFIGNSALQGGGMHSLNSTFTIVSAKFVGNIATEVGGAILSLGDDITCHNINLTGNLGTAVSMFNSKVSFSGDTNIYKNSGRVGGAITARISTVSFTGSTRFEENSAFATGGAVSGEYRTTFQFSGNTTFMNNRARFFGGAIHVFIKVELKLSGLCLFQNNSVDVSTESVGAMEGGREIVGGGGAIFASDTRVTLNDTINFALNLAPNGGAMYFENGATLDIELNATLSTLHNRATKYGGAIYHADSITPSQCLFLLSEKTLDSILTLPNCFLDLKGLRINNRSAPFTIRSLNDSAGTDGSFMFGGLIDKCRIFSLEPSRLYVNATDIVQDVLYIVVVNQNVFDIESIKSISSEAYTLCTCESNEEFNCSEVTNVEAYRGQSFTVSLLALSQGDTITSTLITARISQTARLQLNQSSQFIPQRCTIVTYNLYSTEETEEFVLYPESSCRDTGHAQAIINVTIRPCPDAFNRSGDECVCEERLLALGAECVIFDNDIYIIRKVESRFWFSTLYSNGTYQGLILYQKCPVEFCRTEAVKITFGQLDAQCNLGRSGVLCGACVSNLSLLLGGSTCGKCSNSHLALLLLFAAAGIILVAVLSLLRLTVATGLLNSIILYANMVQANRDLFFPSTTNILTVFIAWMNLDLGFHTCFFDGMDAYAQTFLQFAFPVYVWVIIGLIIVTSRYSIILTKLIGQNPIAVLATLLLMSYTKILKIIIEVYSFGRLQYPGGKTLTVWLRDANVPYLQSRHLFLTIVTSLVLIFIFLPYTIFLLLGYKMYRFSGRKYFRWLNRLKPLLDSYYAPYNNHTRYWTGFLLLVRCALYIVFSFNSLGATNTDESIVVSFTAVIVIAWLSVKIYKNFYANVIEASVYLNLIILAAFTPSPPGLVHTLVGAVFATTIGIVLYHFYLQYVAKSTVWLKAVAKLTSAVKALKNRHVQITEPTPLHLLPPAHASSQDPHKIVSKTVINLREPLLES